MVCRDYMNARLMQRRPVQSVKWQWDFPATVLSWVHVLNSFSLYCSSAGEYHPAHMVHVSDFVGANGNVLLESTAVAVNPDYTLCQDV